MTGPPEPGCAEGIMCRHPVSLAFSKVLAISDLLSIVNYMVRGWWPDLKPQETHNLGRSETALKRSKGEGGKGLMVQWGQQP